MVQGSFPKVAFLYTENKMCFLSEEKQSKLRKQSKTIFLHMNNWPTWHMYTLTHMPKDSRLPSSKPQTLGLYNTLQKSMICQDTFTWPQYAVRCQVPWTISEWNNHRAFHLYLCCSLCERVLNIKLIVAVVTAGSYQYKTPIKAFGSNKKHARKQFLCLEARQADRLVLGFFVKKRGEKGLKGNAMHGTWFSGLGLILSIEFVLWTSRNVSPPHHLTEES